MRRRRFAPADLRDFLLSELDRAAMAHTTFTDDALALLRRSTFALPHFQAVIDLLIEARESAPTVVPLFGNGRHWHSRSLPPPDV